MKCVLGILQSIATHKGNSLKIVEIKEKDTDFLNKDQSFLIAILLNSPVLITAWMYSAAKPLKFASLSVRSTPFNVSKPLK